jgi:hypothetical protein
LCAAIAVIAIVIVIGEGMMGNNDSYFTVKLVNRTGRVARIDNHGVVVRLVPGAADLESGSSTAHQPINIRLGQRQTCSDLLFRDPPARPLAIELLRGQLTLHSASRC